MHIWKWNRKANWKRKEQDLSSANTETGTVIIRCCQNLLRKMVLPKIREMWERFKNSISKNGCVLGFRSNNSSTNTSACFSTTDDIQDTALGNVWKVSIASSTSYWHQKICIIESNRNGYNLHKIIFMKIQCHEE